LVRLYLLRRRVLDLVVLGDLEIAHVLHDLVIEGGVVLEHLGHRHLLEDRVPRALGLAGAAVDTLVGADVELIRPLLTVGARVLVDAVDGADRAAAGVQAITAEARDDVGRAFSSPPTARPRLSLAPA